MVPQQPAAQRTLYRTSVPIGPLITFALRAGSLPFASIASFSAFFVPDFLASRAFLVASDSSSEDSTDSSSSSSSSSCETHTSPTNRQRLHG